MTSDGNDTSAPTFEDAGRHLLAQLDDATQRLAISETVPDEVATLVDRFDELLYARNPEAGFASTDPYLAEGLLGGAVVCLKALRHDDERLARRDLRLGLEQVRQALRDMVDEHAVRADRDSTELVRWLAETASVPQAELADVLGVGARTLQRWLSETDAAAPAGDDDMRLRVVARLVNHLRHSFTGHGAIRWLQRPHPQLDNAAPAELLDDETRFPELVHLAARARSMVAT
jgi:putative toxin-antitoxin system antitoxin component (TIGR02293 family)